MGEDARKFEDPVEHHKRDAIELKAKITMIDSIIRDLNATRKSLQFSLMSVNYNIQEYSKPFSERKWDKETVDKYRKEHSGDSPQEKASDSK